MNYEARLDSGREWLRFDARDDAHALEQAQEHSKNKNRPVFLAKVDDKGQRTEHRMIGLGQVLPLDAAKAEELPPGTPQEQRREVGRRMIGAALQGSMGFNIPQPKR